MAPDRLGATTRGERNRMVEKRGAVVRNPLELTVVDRVVVVLGRVKRVGVARVGWNLT